MKTKKQSEQKKIILFGLFIFLFTFTIRSQTPNSVGIGTTNPNNSALLHLESPNQGFLMTRLTTVQISAITAPTVGLIVYNTNDQCYWYKRPTYWARLCNTDSINAQNVITNTFTADTTFINVNNFGNGYGDSIWVHYAQIDTAIINTLTVHTINADSIFLGGNSITTVITDSIKSLAWLLKGNSGTNPITNFLGTIDNQDLVIRTNNIEKVRVTAPGNVGIGTAIPHSSALLELKGTDKGFLTTRLNTIQINAIVTPTIGLLTYNTDDNCYWFKHPFGWKRICNTDSLGNIFINTLTTNTINAQTINTSTIVAGTGTFTTITTNSLTTNIYNFGNGIGDSIWVHYAQIDTAYIHQLTVNTIKADSIYLGGNSITTVITDSITNLAWLLKGNTGTNPLINFLGTKDNQDLVIRTNSIEKMRVTNTGSVGIGTNAPTAKVEVIGNTKTTNFQMTTAPTNNFIMKSDAAGNGSWSNISSVLTATALNGSGWTILGNTGTTPATNFLGTIDNQDLVIRTNNTEKIRVTNTGSVGIGTNAPTAKVEVIGNTKTTNFQMTTAPTNNFIMKSDAAGNGSWTSLAAMVSTLSPSTFSANAWTILGNAGTTSTVNFVGTTDPQNFTVRTNNVERFSFNQDNQLLAVGVFSATTFNPTFNPSVIPQFSVKTNTTSGLYISEGGGNSVIGLKNKDAIFYQQDNEYNVYTNIPTGGVANTSIFMSNSFNNILNGNSAYLNSSNNISHYFNSFTNSNHNFAWTWAGLPNGGAGGNQFTNTLYSLAMGYRNILTNQQSSYVIGSANTVTLSSLAQENYVFGASNTSTVSSAVMLGFSLRANHLNSMVLGFNTSSHAGLGITMSATGGYLLYSNFANTTGVQIATGGGAWASVSDRRLKENITDISNKSILDKIMSVPVTEWTYISQKVDTMNKYAPSGIHYDKAPIHIGPMAQDFSEIFGYGEFNDKITTSDIDGVMFSGIKALAEENKELKVKLEATLKEFEELKKIVNEIKNH